MSDQTQANDSIRVLVVDDSRLMSTLVQDALLKAGFQVLTAVSGLEAWELLQRELIHLVIADVYMPQLSGLELTRRIRTDKQLSSLPIILMSAIDANEDRQRWLNEGASAYILKEKQELASLADRIINLLQA